MLRELLEAGIRAEIDESDESLGKKIRNAKTQKLPYFLVLGDKEVEADTVTLEARDGTSESMKTNDLITRLKTEIAEKK